MAHGIRLPDEISFLKTLQIEDKVCGGLIDFTPGTSRRSSWPSSINATR